VTPQNLQQDSSSCNVLPRIATWLLYVDQEDGAGRTKQCPVFSYDAVPLALMAQRGLSHQAKRVAGVLLSHEGWLLDTHRIRKLGDPWGGRSIADLSARAGMSETAFRRGRDALESMGILDVATTPPKRKGMRRPPDTYSLIHSHPLLQGQILAVPRALARRAEAPVLHLVALVAHYSGTRAVASQDRSLSELGQALGVSRRRVVDVVASAIELGYLTRLSSSGEISALRIVDAGWWNQEGALLPGRAPVELVEGRVLTWAGSGGDLGSSRRGPGQLPAQTRDASGAHSRDPLRDPLGTPETIPSTHPVAFGDGMAHPPGVRSTGEPERGGGSKIQTEILREGPSAPRNPPGAARPPRWLVHLERRWANAVAERYPGGCLTWSQAERDLVMELAKTYGFEEVEVRLNTHIETWSVRRSKGWLSRRQPDIEPRPALLRKLWAQLAVGTQVPGPGVDAVFEAWSEAYAEVYSGVFVAPWSRSELRLVEELIRDLGSDRTVDLLKHAVLTWKRRTEARSGPNLSLIHAVRQDLLAELSGEPVLALRSKSDIKAEKKQEALQVSEHKPKKRESAVGWNGLFRGMK
jgi:hypothetical protein